MEPTLTNPTWAPVAERWASGDEGPERELARLPVEIAHGLRQRGYDPLRHGRTAAPLAHDAGHGRVRVHLVGPGRIDRLQEPDGAAPTLQVRHAVGHAVAERLADGRAGRVGEVAEVGVPATYRSTGWVTSRARP
jgi:hypothetical protein